MARIWQSGFELNSLTANVEFVAINGSPTIQTSIVRSGTYALKINTIVSGAMQAIRYQFSGALSNGPFFLTTYFYFDTLPSAENAIFSGRDSVNGANRIWVTIDNTGVLRLRDEDGTIGSPSSALTTGMWYKLDMQFDATGAGSTDVIRARVNDVEFAGAANRNISTGIDTLLVGANLQLETQTIGTWYFDDLKINDNTGSSETSYPGTGKVIHLLPDSAGDSNGFLVVVGGTAGSSNNFTRVNEVTPDDATSYNGSALLSAEDLFNCGASGIGAGDAVNVVAVGVRMADLVGADATAAFKLEIEKTTGGTKIQSGVLIPNSTTWRTNQAALPRNYPLVTYQDPDGGAWIKTTLDSMQIGYILTATNVQTIAVSTVWASVDYTPSTDVSIPNTTQFLNLLGIGT